MAHTTTHIPASGSILAPVAKFFSALGTAFVSMGEASSKMRQVNALQALSDEELADRGLKREDIARYVFSDCYWL